MLTSPLCHNSDVTFSQKQLSELQAVPSSLSATFSASALSFGVHTQRTFNPALVLYRPVWGRMFRLEGLEIGLQASERSSAEGLRPLYTIVHPRACLLSEAKIQEVLCSGTLQCSLKKETMTSPKIL